MVLPAGPFLINLIGDLGKHPISMNLADISAVSKDAITLDSPISKSVAFLICVVVLFKMYRLKLKSKFNKINSTGRYGSSTNWTSM